MNEVQVCLVQVYISERQPHAIGQLLSPGATNGLRIKDYQNLIERMFRNSPRIDSWRQLRGVHLRGLCSSVTAADTIPLISQSLHDGDGR